MLLPRLDIVEDDPDCFKMVPGVGYVPTEKATDEQRKAMKKRNKQLDEINNSCVIEGAPI